jgi:hypothetical protein
MVLGVIAGFAIGLLLGLLGGGGSILTVPALVYLAGQSPQLAVTTSLAIVGANSMLGAWFHRLQGTVNWRIAALFGGTGMLLAYFAAGISKLMSPRMLLIAFAVLMLVIGLLMIFRRQQEIQAQEPRGWLVILACGGGVGLLTGILGVGGGFLIVPALVMLIGLPMQEAVGTSLVIIAMNSIAGLAGHLSGAPLDLQLTLIYVTAGLVGTFAGSHLARSLKPAALRVWFAVFVIGLSLFLLMDNLVLKN